MSIDDALKALATIEGQRALTEQLLKNPEEFWDVYIDTMSALDPSPFRALAERLLRSGAVHGMTTIADLPAIFAAEAAGE
jgi:hypothetical protein